MEKPSLEYTYRNGDQIHCVTISEVSIADREDEPVYIDGEHRYTKTRLTVSGIILPPTKKKE